MIVPDDRGWKRASMVIADLDFVGFDDEIADREDQAVLLDHDPCSLALAAKRRRAARIGHRPGLDLDDRAEELLGVDAHLSVIANRLVSAECRYRDRESRGQRPADTAT